MRQGPSRIGRARVAALCLMLVGLVAAAGCTDYQQLRHETAPGQPPRGVPSAGMASAAHRHLVLEGETLSGIAQRYRVPMADLARINRIRPPYRIYVGQVLAVPGRGAARPMTAARAEPPRLNVLPVPRPAGEPQLAIAAPAADEVQDEALREATRRAAETRPAPLSGDGFLWPVAGEVLDGFGDKPNGMRNDGINIGAASGTPVRAAEHGVVVYAGSTIPGFGNMLLVRHADGFTTAYAHNGELLVAVGDRVRRGQTIATVGATGDVTSPQLHFELRLGAKAVDPARHLVGREAGAAGAAPTS